MKLAELSKEFWVITGGILILFFAVIILFPPKDDGNRSFNKIYTVTKISKNCNPTSSCSWDIEYSNEDEELSSTVTELDFEVGDKVYERLVCKRISGPNAGKEYDPRVKVERSNSTHSFWGFGGSRGGWCEMKFKGLYKNNVPD